MYVVYLTCVSADAGASGPRANCKARSAKTYLRLTDVTGMEGKNAVFCRRQVCLSEAKQCIGAGTDRRGDSPLPTRARLPACLPALEK